MVSYSEKGHTLYNAEAWGERGGACSHKDSATIWRMPWKKKIELDEEVWQLYGDFAAVTSSLTLVLFLGRITPNALCNAITKFQYDFNTSA